VCAKSSEAHTRRPQRAAHLSSNCGASCGASCVPARRASVLYTSAQVNTARHGAVAARVAHQTQKGVWRGKARSADTKVGTGVRTLLRLAHPGTYRPQRCLQPGLSCWLVDRRRQRTLNTLGCGPGWSAGLDWAPWRPSSSRCRKTGPGIRQALTMAKAKKVSVADTRKPKNPLDANRPSKGGKNQRDAATVGAQTCHNSHGAAVRGEPGRQGPSAAGARRAGAAAQHVQEDGDARQAREDPAPGAPRSPPTARLRWRPGCACPTPCVRARRTSNPRSCPTRASSPTAAGSRTRA